MSEISTDIVEQQESALASEKAGEKVVEAVNNSDILEDAAEVVAVATAAAHGDASNTNVSETSKTTPLTEESSSSSSPKVETKKTPAKRTPSKRMSFIERAQKESEELVRNMGGSLELEGGRRTRSSARGTPTRSAVVVTPPPTKKARTSPAAAVATGSSTPSRGRGRGRKIDTSTSEVPITPTDETKEKAKVDELDTTPTKGDVLDCKESNETKEEETENVAVAAKQTASNSQDTEAEKVEQQQLKESATPVVEKCLDNKTVPESKQNNIDHVVAEEEEDEQVTKIDDSPMETDESVENEAGTTASAAVPQPPASEVETDTIQQKSDSVSETLAPILESKEKLPTPEPMEVDGSSKSDDVIEATEVTATNTTAAAAVEQLIDDDDNAVIEKPVTTTTNTNSVAPKCDAQSALQLTKEAAGPNATVAYAHAAIADKVIDEAATIIGENDIAKTLSTPIQAAPAAGKTDANPANEGSINVAATTNIENSSNKAESNCCEPKIASPSISTTASDATAATTVVVTTPQYCN